MLFHHLTIKDSLSYIEIEKRKVALENHLRRAIRHRHITYFQGPYYEERNGESSFVYHYQWPNGSMHTTVIGARDFKVVNEHLMLINQGASFLSLQEPEWGTLEDPSERFQ